MIWLLRQYGFEMAARVRDAVFVFQKEAEAVVRPHVIRLTGKRTLQPRNCVVETSHPEKCDTAIDLEFDIVRSK